MGLMSRGMGLLTRLMKQSAGETITYSRGDSFWSFTAWPGSQLFAVSAPDDKARVIHGDADWLFMRSDAETEGLPFPPKKGDRITVTLAGDSIVFELSTPTGEAVWRFSDPQRTIVRVHTRRVG